MKKAYLIAAGFVVFGGIVAFTPLGGSLQVTAAPNEFYKACEKNFEIERERRTLERSNISVDDFCGCVAEKAPSEFDAWLAAWEKTKGPASDDIIRRGKNKVAGDQAYPCAMELDPNS